MPALIAMSAHMIRRIGKKHYLVATVQTRRGNDYPFDDTCDLCGCIHLTN